MKIDFSNIVKDNIQHVNKYTIFYKKSKLFFYFAVMPVFSLLGILGYYELKAPFYMWIFLFVALTAGTLISYWVYTKIYDVNIQSIKKSLEELDELREE